MLVVACELALTVHVCVPPFPCSALQISLSGQWDAGVFSVSVTKAGFPAASASFAITRGADPSSPSIALRVGLKGARLLRTLCSQHPTHNRTHNLARVLLLMPHM